MTKTELLNKESILLQQLDEVRSQLKPFLEEETTESFRHQQQLTDQVINCLKDLGFTSTYRPDRYELKTNGVSIFADPENYELDLCSDDYVVGEMFFEFDSAEKFIEAAKNLRIKKYNVKSSCTFKSIDSVLKVSLVDDPLIAKELEILNIFDNLTYLDSEYHFDIEADNG